MKNIFENLPDAKLDEIFEPLVENNGIKIERITSFGQATPEDQWLVQEIDEWVLLLKGKAGLLIKGSEEETMKPGDYLLIPAHSEHRVTWTEENKETVWLAIHC